MFFFFEVRVYFFFLGGGTPFKKKGKGKAPGSMKYLVKRTKKPLVHHIGLSLFLAQPSPSPLQPVLSQFKLIRTMEKKVHPFVRASFQADLTSLKLGNVLH